MVRGETARRVLALLESKIGGTLAHLAAGYAMILAARPVWLSGLLFVASFWAGWAIVGMAVACLRLRLGRINHDTFTHIIFFCAVSLILCGWLLGIARS
ncbi:MAG TPA: hypothetical protein VGE07_11670 [Herpetosiphonaceae bacterium]